MIILIPKKTGIPGSCFCNWSFPNLGEILIHGLSLIQLPVLWNYPHFPSIANGAALLRSSRFIVCYAILLLMISLLKGTGAFWESPGSCVFDYSSCSNCSNFLITPTGTGALGKLKIHAWEMLSTHRSYYNYYSYSDRGRCLLLSSRITFVFQCF